MSPQASRSHTDELFRLLIEGVKDYAIFLLDPEGRVVSWNAGAERVLGYSEVEMLGRHYSCLFTSEDAMRGEPEQELRTALNADRSEDVRWHLRKDGTRFWGDGVVTALRNGDGSIRFYAKLLRDKTDQKELEDLLRHRAESLADADHQKNVFLATLAHELRNPLGGIVNATNVLRLMSKDNATLEQPLQIMERQAAHLRRLIDDLMDVAKISAGKIQLQKERVELALVVRGAVEATRSFLEAHQHQLSVSLPVEPIYLEADPVRLQQVLANLLINAGKYTDPGGQITLSGTVQDGEIVVRVRDTGIGISADMLPRIFELFTQVDPAKGYTHGGLGIGLALVKELCHLARRLRASASEGNGKGSEFAIRLPGRSAPDTA